MPLSFSEQVVDTPISVGISACLLGEKVRFDTGHKYHSYINKSLGKFFDFQSHCPEMAIGLGTPRETLRLAEKEGEVRCIGNKTPDFDVTDRLRQDAESKNAWLASLDGFILKKDSPSCGMERVRLYRGDMPKRDGVGIFAERLLANFPQLPVEEEGRLGDSVLRENFVKRVFAHAHWRQINSAQFTLKHLYDFHAQYKYVLLAHHEERSRALGAALANISRENFAQFAVEYFTEFMTILATRATRAKHVNVLQHLQGFLKTGLDKEDKAELVETIADYHAGLLPLIVPVTLLRHHFRRTPNPYILKSRYLAPHPAELMLLNEI